MENRITKLFENKDSNILNIYFTAGYPSLEDTVPVLESLEKSGVDMVEIGMPYSDPMADGPIIQQSNDQAIKNGMSIAKLLEQLKGIRDKITIPILLMGYVNPVMQYGIEKFCKDIASIGIDGLILPDLPFAEYNDLYKKVFENNNLSNIFLITPQTSVDRLKLIDGSSKGFLYIVSTHSTTGNASKDIGEQESYFKRVNDAGITNPTLIGFNIKDKSTFEKACNHANGAIVGSAFVKLLGESKDLDKDISEFVKSIRSSQKAPSLQ